MKKPLLFGCGCLGLLLLCCCASSASMYTTNAILIYNPFSDENEVENVDDQLEELNRFVEEELIDEFNDEYDEQADQLSDVVVEEYGFIQGSLGFPSEGIPPLEICAVNTTSGESYCTRDIIDDSSFVYTKGYKLEVPSGTYNVYSSQIIDNETVDDYRAYYSEFVECGLDISCPSHLPVDVIVITGDTVSEVDPIDWYAQ